MRALVVREPGRYAVEELPEPDPGPGEALVAVAAAGICGSDLELVDGRRPAAYVRYPVVPGHEWAGRVVRAGPGVDGLAPGDPVVAEGLRSCDRCARCAEGAAGLLDPAPLVTHRFGLDEAPQALAALAAADADAVKVLIRPGG
jgi:threonine dehydrogenase-like Zn-dependent dehydrogenase